MRITNTTSTPIDIAVSGLKAQSTRLNVVANNIANASTTRTPGGEPYRRQDVSVTCAGKALSGIKTVQIVPDMGSGFKRVHQPGHPDADGDGFVLMPNVDVPTEMMHMVVASRAYQANASVMKRYQDQIDATLELLR